MENPPQWIIGIVSERFDLFYPTVVRGNAEIIEGLTSLSRLKKNSDLFRPGKKSICVLLASW